MSEFPSRKKNQVIATKNLSRRIPLHPTLTLWLTLKVFDAPEWVWGAVGLFVFILWASWLYGITMNEEVPVDIFKQTSEGEGWASKKTNWDERFKDMQKDFFSNTPENGNR